MKSSSKLTLARWRRSDGSLVETIYEASLTDDSLYEATVLAAGAGLGDAETFVTWVESDIAVPVRLTAADVKKPPKKAAKPPRHPLNGGTHPRPAPEPEPAPAPSSSQDSLF